MMSLGLLIFWVVVAAWYGIMYWDEKRKDKHHELAKESIGTPDSSRSYLR